MQLARVIGEVVATVKDPNLGGRTLLVLQPITASGEAAGRTLVALDSVGAGVGEHVFFVRGREAAFPFYPSEPPADASAPGTEPGTPPDDDGSQSGGDKVRPN